MSIEPCTVMCHRRSAMSYAPACSVPMESKLSKPDPGAVRTQSSRSPWSRGQYSVVPSSVVSGPVLLSSGNSQSGDAPILRFPMVDRQSQICNELLPCSRAQRCPPAAFPLPSAYCLLPCRPPTLHVSLFTFHGFRLSALRVPASPCPRVAVSRPPSPVNGQPSAFRNPQFAIRNSQCSSCCLLPTEALTSAALWL